MPLVKSTRVRQRSFRQSSGVPKRGHRVRQSRRPRRHQVRLRNPRSVPRRTPLRGQLQDRDTDPGLGRMAIRAGIEAPTHAGQRKISPGRVRNRDSF